MKGEERIKRDPWDQILRFRPCQSAGWRDTRSDSKVNLEEGSG